jgi:hypothetical protein
LARLRKPVQFWQFQVKIKEGAKLEDLKTQDVLRYRKGLRNIKKPRWKKIQAKSRSRKNRMVWFWIPEGLFS